MARRRAARNFIRYTKGLAKRAEVLGIAADLGIDRRHAAGLCMDFWDWADGETKTGRIRGLTPDGIDDIVAHKGFAKAFERAQWVRFAPGVAILPRWTKHNGESTLRRAEEADRKALAREREKGDSSAIRPRNVRQKSRHSREEQSRADKSREEKQKQQQQDPHAPPPVHSNGTPNGAARTDPARAPLHVAAVAAKATRPASPEDLPLALSDRTNRVAILSKIFQPRDAERLADDMGATGERLAWLVRRVAREKPKNPQGFIRRGIQEAWDVPP